MKRMLCTAYLLSAFFLLTACCRSLYARDLNCFTILAGRYATADGSVLLAHNEDGSGHDPVHWHKVKASHSDNPGHINTDTDVIIPQAEDIAGYLWLEIPGRSFSDSYMNEYGVAIASNQCKSREDKPDLTDGGIGYWLRRLMAERAHTAREAVIIGGELIDQFGYHSSGRTYCIADAKEAWMMSVVNGKHWIARRIPDSMVTVIPNYYTIDEIRLADTVNYLGSSDLIVYAIERGWYDPASGRSFSFRLAYGDPASLGAISNIARQWQGINRLSAKQYSLNEKMPFAFKPAERLSPEKLFPVLQDHYENSILQSGSIEKTDPHKNDTMRICSDRNQYGFVAHLRSHMPAPAASVLWLAPPHPCMQPFIPWYAGIQYVPVIYSGNEAGYAIAHHFDPARATEAQANHAYRIFLDIATKYKASYPAIKESMTAYKINRQAEIKVRQKIMEENFMKEYLKNPAKAMKMLTDFTNNLALEEFETTRKMLREIE